MRAALAAAGAAFLLVAATGCGQRSEPTGPAVKLYPVTVQQPGGGPSIVLRSKPAHIAALTTQAAELVSAVEGHRVPVSAAPSGATDLIVTTIEGPSGLRYSPPPYVAPDGSIRDVERSLTDLGLLLGRPLAGRGLVERIESQRRFVRTHLAGTKPVTVFVDAGFFTTVSTQTLIGDILFEAGGRNVVGPNQPPGPFSIRKLRRLNPDYYLATSDSGTTLRDLRRDPRTRRLQAVRTRHFAVIPSKLLQPGPGIARALALVAHVLHPHAFR